jgi:hypothetical protein
VARRAATMAVFVSQTARAGSDGAAESSTPTTVPPDDTRYVDAHCDHVVLSSTAETHPKGTFFVTDYEVIVPHVGYALTDRYELMLTWVFLSWIDVAMKLNVYRGKFLRSAVVGAFDLPTAFEATPMWRLVGIQQFCFTRACWSSVSVNALGLVNQSGDYPQSRTLFDVSAGGIVALGRVVKLLVEPRWTWEPAFSSEPTFGVGGGIRFSGTHFGVDLGWVPVGEPYEALPWLAFTYRTAGDRPGD